MNVPSTHNNNHKNNKEEPMEINPFPIQEEETVKIVLKHQDGSITENDLWYAAKQSTELNSMNFAKAIYEAMTNQKMLEEILSQHRSNLRKEIFFGGSGMSTEGDFAEPYSLMPFELIGDNLTDLIRINDDFINKSGQAFYEEETTAFESEYNKYTYNYSPTHAYSCRTFDIRFSIRDATEPFSYERIRKVVDVVDVDQMLVTEMTNNDKFGWIVEFRTSTYNSQGQHYTKRWPATCLITRTSAGYRLLWKIKKSKKNPASTAFGVSYFLLMRKKMLPQTLYTVFKSFCNDSIPAKHVLPILGYIGTHNSHVEYMYSRNLYPHGITMSDIYWIGGETSIKKILNKALKHPHGVTKKIFGNIAHVDSFDKLRVAIFVMRSLKGFQPHMLEEFNIETITGHLSWDENSINTKAVKSIQMFFTYFGFKERYAKEIFNGTVLDAVQFVNEGNIAQERLLNNLPLHEINTNTNIDTIMTIVRMFKEIKGRNMRSAMKHHISTQKLNIQEIEAYVSIEYNRLNHPDKSFAQSEVTKVFGKYDEYWISENIQLCVPKSSYDLIEWGSTQNNCIGSYGDIIENGSTMIIGFKDKSNNWISHAEIREASSASPHQLVVWQLYGKYNSHINYNDATSILQFLENELSIKATPQIQDIYKAP